MDLHSLQKWSPLSPHQQHRRQWLNEPCEVVECHSPRGTGKATKETYFHRVTYITLPPSIIWSTQEHEHLVSPSSTSHCPHPEPRHLPVPCPVCSIPQWPAVVGAAGHSWDNKQHGMISPLAKANLLTCWVWSSAIVNGKLVPETIHGKVAMKFLQCGVLNSRNW